MPDPIKSAGGQGSLEWILVIVLVVLAILTTIYNLGIGDKMGRIANSVANWLADANAHIPTP